jgi:hypothetical protein
MAEGAMAQKRSIHEAEAELLSADDADKSAERLDALFQRYGQSERPVELARPNNPAKAKPTEQEEGSEPPIEEDGFCPLRDRQTTFSARRAVDCEMSEEELLRAEDAIEDAERLDPLFRRRQTEQLIALRLPLSILMEAIDSSS